MSVKIKCPKCQRVLGDTNRSLDATLNCPNCKKVDVRITFADSTDYFNHKKGKETND